MRQRYGAKLSLKCNKREVHIFFSLILRQLFQIQSFVFPFALMERGLLKQRTSFFAPLLDTQLAGLEELRRLFSSAFPQ